MAGRKAISLIGFVTYAVAQTTYTGCHMHESVSYCFGTDGNETPMTTVMPSTTPAPTAVAASTTAGSTGQTTAVTACHEHGSEIYCIDGSGAEVSISTSSVSTASPSPLPAQYTDCHSHGEEKYCVDPAGNDVLVLSSHETESDHSEHEHEHEGEEEAEVDCHFHAGVEHCTVVGQSESSSEGSVESGASAASVCSAPAARDYNVGLRIGSIFIILATSGLAVFLPLFLHKLPLGRFNNTIFIAIKQFGTGIIISTAFVHLYTHAYLMFTNQCLTGIDYEATTSAVVMAGLFIAFLVEYSGYRFVMWKDSKKSHHTEDNHSSSEDGSTQGQETKAVVHNHVSGTALQNISHSHAPADFNPNTPLAVAVMEAGILFHSVLIGLTLVVAPDSSGRTSGYYNTLLAVIVFHQFFEGLALGARIALLPVSKLALGIWSKIIMAGAFAMITPLGMAIGIGVLNQFNGNDESTILTIAVLDALSAGVLLWVGVIDMWGRDWVVTGGEMVDASAGKVVLGLGSLVAGLVLMSVLGKWA